MSRITTVTIVTMALLASLGISTCALADKAEINSSSNLVQSSIISQESPSLVGSWNCQFSHPETSVERNTRFNLVFTLDGRFSRAMFVNDPYMTSLTTEEGTYQLRDNLIEVILQRYGGQNPFPAAIYPYIDQSVIQWISPNKFEVRNVGNKTKTICLRA